jgi:hypothetical protein
MDPTVTSYLSAFRDLGIGGIALAILLYYLTQQLPILQDIRNSLRQTADMQAALSEVMRDIHKTIGQGVVNGTDKPTPSA